MLNGEHRNVIELAELWLKSRPCTEGNGAQACHGINCTCMIMYSNVYTK